MATEWELLRFPLRVVTRTYDCADGNRMFMGHIEDGNGKVVVRRDSSIGVCRNGWETEERRNTEMLNAVACALNRSGGVR